ncbi:hypothetical protein Sste5346_003398 [Sporothrix stenoceras]|uniref:DUF7730 domain-containing protein n=1 Tax=Sporothrix stenoceras TaxID=5173 RepID=A0ABR3ZDS0_9PEZI
MNLFWSITLAAALWLCTASAVPALTNVTITPCDNLIMAMESLESLQAYLQGLMNLGGTTAAERPSVQSLFTAMDHAVSDINGVYTAVPECKQQYADDMVNDSAPPSSPTPPFCIVLQSAISQISTIEKQTTAAAATDPNTDLSPLQTKLESAKVDVGQAINGWHRNTYESPFLRLPPEIRNRIYALALTVGQIHVRYRPWRQRMIASGGNNNKKTPSKEMHGGFYAVALGVDQDAWKQPSKTTSNKTKTRAVPLPDALTPLAAVCRQLYSDTAALPFALNAWSFESARLMERYLVREKRLTLYQRRAIAVLVVSVSDDLPSRAMEKYLGGLRAVVWRDGKTVQRWELASATELQRLVATTQKASSLQKSRNALRLYE